MASKYFSDVKPNRDDKDGSQESIHSRTAKTKPTGNPSGGSMKGPETARTMQMKEKGGKDLPVPSFEMHKHRAEEAKAPLPKGI